MVEAVTLDRDGRRHRCSVHDSLIYGVPVRRPVPLAFTSSTGEPTRD